MRPGRGLALALTLGLFLGLGTPVWAGAPSEQLFGAIDRVMKILEDPALRPVERTAERRQAIRRVADGIFDFTEIARRSLGRHWPARTPAEREEFTRLFANLLERSYIGKFDTYNGEKIVMLGESVDGDLATVKTRIVTKSGTEIPVDYRLLLRDGRWRAYDVAIEGVSLVANYRSQFDKIIQRGSFQELVRKVREKQAEDEAALRTKRVSQK
jgi:phospholipid transport system substrate-binding protein